MPAEHPSRQELDAKLGEATKPILTELRWQRWMLAVVMVATLSPRVGGPTPPQVASVLLEGVARAAG